MDLAFDDGLGNIHTTANSFVLERSKCQQSLVLGVGSSLKWQFFGLIVEKALWILTSVGFIP